MSDDYWKPTAELFEQLFSKPKMTEKLLQRPPFRYIHDIYTATLQATGFGEGLYSEEELNAKEIKDKDGKVNFLDKLVALVQVAAGEEIPVKSTKIVAGQEPEATNIFLQYLFKVATSGIDSGPIVAQILGEGGDEDGGRQNDGDDGEDEEAAAAAAEEEARRAAEEEENRKKDKRNQKKKQMEDEKLKQQQEEENNKKKAKAEAERKAQEKREAEEAAKAKASKKAPPKKVEEPPPPAKVAKKNAIIEDGQDDGDNEENIIVDEDDNGMNAGIDINDVDPESKFGKKAMAQLRAQEEEEEADRNLNDDGGAGGVKMGKIRRNRKKAGGVERSEPQKKVLQSATEAPQRSFGGYGEEDIEYLRKSIQMLCQNTNPLGKSIDFVTEDIDSMVKEYDHWKRDFVESQGKLEEQQKITEQTIQPLQDVQLAQLEERIREEKSKIQNIRSQIIRNDTIIQNLLIQ